MVLERLHQGLFTDFIPVEVNPGDIFLFCGDGKPPSCTAMGFLTVLWIEALFEIEPMEAWPLWGPQKWCLDGVDHVVDSAECQWGDVCLL